MPTSSSDAHAFDTIGFHSRLITNVRYKQDGSAIKGRSLDEEATSDRARVLYSSAFRRLQQKTQVFTLARDAAVRSRLTHSLEVASVGRWIAQKVVDDVLLPKNDGRVDAAYTAAFVSLVETGCLAHDIGNPPFGHFGEYAIQDWFRSNWTRVAGHRVTPKLTRLMQDFENFDGNPQGIRILTRLQGRTKDERNKYGMDLTFSQILTALKYPRGPLDDGSRWRKAGFFESERDKIAPAWSALDYEVQRRFPLAYIVEAADDISYCISDMEDGIDQGILDPNQVFDGIASWVHKSGKLERLRDVARGCTTKARATSIPSEAKDQFMVFKTEFTRTMIDEAAAQYGDGRDIASGEKVSLLADTDADELLELLKANARGYLYPADKVQRPFLAGGKVVRGVLDEYSSLLKLSQEQFTLLRRAWKAKDRREVRENQLETLLPLLDSLPAHYLEVYDHMVTGDSKAEETGAETWEWFCRAHLIVDYLSGMSDDFAFRTYQVMSGVQLD